MSCHDLLKAASSQVERYAQVDIHSEADDAESRLLVRSEAAHHVAHLLAELIDNATTFSPPGARVLVHATARSGQVVVTITDKGIGFDPTALQAANARLAVPTLDVTTVRAMGLTVVGHIASWYGIQVHLASVPAGTAGERGTVATVRLPATVFRTDQNTDSNTDQNADSTFDWFDRGPGAGTAVPAPEPEPEPRADQRDAAEIAGVMTAFARGIGAYRNNDPGPENGAANLVEHT
jgi:anti-sigma regulatory factor (Ser/Thr protein kinase)